MGLRALVGRLDVDRIIAIATLAALLYVAISISSRSGAGQSVDARPAPQLDTSKGKVLAIRQQQSLGSQAAPVVLVFFSDFLCKFCQVLANERIPALMADYVTPGKVSLSFRHFPRSSRARDIARLAECAGRQGRFWSVHDSLFKTPPEASDELIPFATTNGVQLPELSTCMVGGLAGAAVDSDFAEGQALGLRGTPTLYIGSRLSEDSMKVHVAIPGAVPLETLRTALDAAIVESKR